MKRFLKFSLILFGVPLLVLFITSMILSPFENDYLLANIEMAYIAYSAASFLTGVLFFKPITKLSKFQKWLLLPILIVFAFIVILISMSSFVSAIIISTPILLGFFFRMLVDKKIKAEHLVVLTVFVVVFTAGLLAYLKQKNDFSQDNDLIEAVLNDDLKEVRSLIEKGEDPNSTDETLATPFMWASLKGNVKIMRFLKENGADCKKNGVISLDNFERIYNSPINASAGEGHLNAVKFMVEECRIDVNEDVKDYNHFYITNKDVYDAFGAYSFLKNTKNKKLSAIKLIENTNNAELLRGNIAHQINRLLMKFNLSAIEPVPIGKENKFLQALKNREIIDKNLYSYIVPNRSGYEILSKFHFGCTPLVEAAGKGNTDIVEYLLKKGAEVDKTPDGITALMISVAKNHFDIAKLLIENGANIKVVDEDLNQTAFLSLTAKRELTFKENEREILELAKLIINKGANVNQKNIYGYTPLAFACRFKNKNLVEILVANKADPDIEVNGVKIRDICKRNGIEIPQNEVDDVK